VYTQKQRQALILAVAAVIAAAGAARWETVMTADERAGDRLTIGETVAPHEPATNTTVSSAPATTSGSSAMTFDSANLRAGPTAAVQPVLGETLDSIGRAAQTPTTPPSAATTTTVQVTTTPPPPTTAPPPAQPTSLDARGQAALASISYPWQSQLPGWQIRFHPGIDGAYGYTLTDESIIDIYIRDGQSDQLLAHVVAHEIGHAVDVTLNDSTDRDRWQQTRGIDAQWWPDNRASDFATGAGDFAESFAAWQVGTASFRSQLGGPPTADQLAVLADLASG